MTTAKHKANPEAEIADRSTDGDAEESTLYTKQFLVASSLDDSDWDSFDHTANAAALCQEAINNGLRIVGTVTFDGAEDGGQLGHAVDQNGKAVQRQSLLTYTAEAVPAHRVGAGATIETSNQDGTMEDVISPRDILTADDDNTGETPESDEVV